MGNPCVSHYSSLYFDVIFFEDHDVTIYRLCFIAESEVELYCNELHLLREFDRSCIFGTFDM